LDALSTSLHHDRVCLCLADRPFLAKCHNGYGHLVQLVLSRSFIYMIMIIIHVRCPESDLIQSVPLHEESANRMQMAPIVLLAHSRTPWLMMSRSMQTSLKKEKDINGLHVHALLVLQSIIFVGVMKKKQNMHVGVDGELTSICKLYVVGCNCILGTA